LATSLVETERVINVLQGATSFLNALSQGETLLKGLLVVGLSIFAIKKASNFIDE
jgi:hypothetical protein